MQPPVHPDLPGAHDDHIHLRTSAEAHLAIRKAAALIGWTVPQYVLSAALDRAERDLYAHASAHDSPDLPEAPSGPSPDPYMA
ncbi:type II toxin -antitoxin system TacA 1-like antitoxin, partial [Actinomadura sp. WAC 06369]|uniref:type II toxin -antitoxin system TacA 1-like antitoxin n=2 Tax=Actinomadura TaxID=1988 RepID=UPI000F7B6E8E